MWLPSSSTHFGRHIAGLIALIVLAALRSASWKPSRAAATPSISAWWASTFSWSSVQSSSPSTLSTKANAFCLSRLSRSACGFASETNVSRALASASMSSANSSAVVLTGSVEESNCPASGAL
ncbi:hypothetical protein DMH02_005615 [Streptomyces sp. WAC 00631]|uniref:hypothetical protein n=1 Tax=Streptomyces sp. WAC 00631 TaxID=2203201 RepID=UPI000F78312A|nr:hypothetical protein [Streptomyces sp. WAC 00631]MCC5032730.1 hypothetical protein [Streptomyces sp. WAC 00631]